MTAEQTPDKKRLSGLIAYRGKGGEKYPTSEVRLKESGVPVWVIIGYLQSGEGDVDLVAKAFRVSVEDVEAARRYYELHKQVIDGRLSLGRG